MREYFPTESQSDEHILHVILIHSISRYRECVRYPSDTLRREPCGERKGMAQETCFAIITGATSQVLDSTVVAGLFAGLFRPLTEEKT